MQNDNNKTLSFAMVTDTHLAEQENDFLSELRLIDSANNLNGIIHLGGVINGDNPKQISLRLLRESLLSLSNSIKSNRIYPCIGITDGWRNERYLGQLVCNIITDEAYHNATTFIDSYSNVSRPGNKPYYYVDVAPQIRFVFLSSFTYQIDDELGLYEKNTSYGVDQLRWLMLDVLPTSVGKTVYLFSNRLPGSVFESCLPYYVYEGNSTEPIIAMLQQFAVQGVNFGAWFIGGYNRERITHNCGITQVLLSSFFNWYTLNIDAITGQLSLTNNYTNNVLFSNLK